MTDRGVGHEAPFPVPLSGEERMLLSEGLTQWHGPAHPTDAIAQALGFEDVDDLLHRRGQRLYEALGAGEALSYRDWRRVLAATAVVFADNTTGAGLDWPIATPFTDGRTIAVLRALQERILRMAPLDEPGPHNALTDRARLGSGGRGHVFAFAPTASSTAAQAPSDTASARAWSDEDAEMVSCAIDLAAARTIGRAPRVCLLPTASGDHPATIEAAVTMLTRRRPDVALDVVRLFPHPNVADLDQHLRAQDVVLALDGSVTAAAALWAVQGMRTALLLAWRSGVVLTGPGAGALCWHASGITTDAAQSASRDRVDGLPDGLAVFTDGLGFLRHSLNTDDAGDRVRAAHYRRLIAAGALHAGYAVDAGVGLHYTGEGLSEVVSARSGGRAWRVEPSSDGGYREQPLPARAL